MDPKFLDKLNKKDEALDQRLKSVYVTSEDKFVSKHDQMSMNCCF